MKKLDGMEGLKDNAEIYSRIQGLKREGTEKCDFPVNIHATLKKKKAELIFH